MNDKNKYNNALEKLQEALAPKNGCEISGLTRGCIEEIFPELKESEDERIRKELIRYFEGMNFVTQEGAEKVTRWIAWLEKQGNKLQDKSALEASKEEKVDNANKSVLDFKASDYYVSKVDGKIHNIHYCNVPKFKVGNWYQCIKDFFGKGVTFDKNTAYYCAKEGCLQFEYGCHMAIDKNLYDNFKLWSIEDAKDGDVLAEDSCIFILKGMVNDFHAAITYCTLFNDGEFHASETIYFDVGSTRPATKEQRDTLMKAMADAGCTFDFEKKELKGIEPHNSDNVEQKFKVGDWITDGYLHCKISDVLDDRYIVDTKFTKRSAIPFKRENEYHLWTIEDAKDGDILASIYNKPFIYNGNHNSIHVGAYCGITTNDKLIIASEECHWTENLNIHPANKDQRDILMNAMNDDGYVFDFDKKELKKMIYLSAKHNSQPIKPTDE